MQQISGKASLPVPQIQNKRMTQLPYRPPLPRCEYVLVDDLQCPEGKVWFEFRFGEGSEVLASGAKFTGVPTNSVIKIFRQ